MDKYFELLKGPTGAGNQGDCFGDLLKECRILAKEKVTEEQAPFTKQEIQHEIDTLKDKMKELDPRDYESEDEYDEYLDGLEGDLERLEDDLEDAPPEDEFESKKVDEAVWEVTWIESGHTEDLTDAEAIEMFGKDEWAEISQGYLPHIVAVPISEKKVTEQDFEEPSLERPGLRKPEEEPDPDAPPPPPEEIKEPEKPMEMRKEYLGQSEDVHFYFITTEGGDGVVDDFVIVDQEGVKKYSAKDKNIEVVEENIADFLIQAVRDIDIAQIERSVFMKYIYPKLVERAPEEDEEMFEEPEEDEEGKEKPLGPEEEEIPRESKKVNESKVDEKKPVPTCDKCGNKHWPFQKCTKVKEEIVTEQEDNEEASQLGSRVKVLKGANKGSEGKIVDVVQLTRVDVELDSGEQQYCDLEDVDILEESKTDEDVSGWRQAVSKAELRKMKKAKKEKEKSEPKKDESNLIEMKVTDDDGNNFDVHLVDVDDDTEDTVVQVNGREFRFSSEFASMWRDDEGALSEEGLRELALDALSNLENEDYNELVGQTKGDDDYFGEDPYSLEGDEDVSDMGKSVPGETDWPLKDRPAEVPPEHETEEIAGAEEPESAEGGEEERTTDDVDMSKPGNLNRPPKYRAKREEQIPEPVESKVDENFEDIEQELDTLDQMSIEELRDVVGEAAQRLPEKDDLIDAAMHDKFGDKYTNYLKRQVGLEKKEENIEGDNDMDEKKTPDSLRKRAKELDAEANKLRKEADSLVVDLKAKEKAKKDEGINPKAEDSEETKIKKLAEDEEVLSIDAMRKVLADFIGDTDDADVEEMYSKYISKTNEQEEVKEGNVSETDVAKGAKALIQLAKDALKDGDYQKAAEYSTKLAEIEAVVPPEAEREVRDDKPKKKDEPKPDEKDDDNEKDEEKADEQIESTEEKVDEAKKDKAKKDKAKEDKAKKDKKDKEDKAKKDKEDKAKKDKEDKAKKDKSKKESKIQVESTEDISEKKAMSTLRDLLGMN